MTAATLGLTGVAEAVTLVSPDGSPVGAPWQQWANESMVPTIHGPLTFTSIPGFCGAAGACSSGPVPPYSAAVPVLTNVWMPPQQPASAYLERNALYFELGHQFDWKILTARDRRFLAHEWGHPHARWWDSVGAINQRTEDGLEGDFASIYADCAWGLNDEGAAVKLMAPVGSTIPAAPQANPRINTCTYIDKIARRAQADMESSAVAPWNRKPSRSHGST